MKHITTFLFFILFLILSWGVLSMPAMGDPNAPAHNQLAEIYKTRSLEDTGAANVIAAIITDYRAFDTLGETTVLFTSIAAVVSIMGATSKKGKDHE
jgi:multisubunit Na+/H+ antiporter MnhB subunit